MRTAFVAIALCFSIAFNIVAQTKIEVDVNRPLFPVSKNLYGIFFEDINHAGDGGLYAEMINNRSFEANRMPEDMYRIGDYVYSKQGFKVYYPQPAELEGWEVIISGNAKGEARQDDAFPLNQFNLKSMKLVVSQPDNGNFKVINKGYWGISVIKGEKYQLSIYLRSLASASIKVALEDLKGKVIDAKIIKGIPKEWKKYEITFTATATEPQAVFSISPQTPTTYWVDMVSLFPEKTFKRRTNGVRADIAQMIADFKPGFLRFPGGCVVEGADYENRIIW
ncbi:MAG: carbohydrate binding domain-containing protein, partial [Bacteroidales bacterium]|nr:carbohydrate binding domain-containing protein [Bacteroidales bacterium]